MAIGRTRRGPPAPLRVVGRARSIAGMVTRVHRSGEGSSWVARLTLGVLLAFALALAAPPAWGANAYHHDLTSLALLSDAVVLAERGASREVLIESRYPVTVTRYHVTRVWRGALHPGDDLDVLDGGFSLQHFVGRAAPTFDRTALLFLSHVDPASSLPPGTTWWAVAGSGLRVFAGGRVYRFEQRSNPGPYEPCPQGNDPLDVRGFEPSSEPITMGAFEPALARALARAEAFRGALAEPTPRRRAALLAFLDTAPEPPAVVPTGYDGHYRDELAWRVVERLHNDGDLDGVLEAVARTSLGLDLFEHNDILLGHLGAVLAAAADASRPLHRRVAALEVLRQLSLWWAGGTDETQAHPRLIADGVVALLGDPQPVVRAAAALALGWAGTQWAIARPALERAWRTDGDPAVRYAVAWAIRGLRGDALPPRGDGLDLLLAARVDGPFVRWGAQAVGRDVPSLSRLTLVAASAQDAGAPRRLGLALDRWWSTTGARGGAAPWAFDPPLPRGDWALHLEAEFEGEDAGTARTWPVGTVRVDEATPGSTAVSVVPVVAPPRSGPAPRYAARDGCGRCVVSGATSGRISRGWGGWLVLAILMIRRGRDAFAR